MQAHYRKALNLRQLKRSVGCETSWESAEATGCSMHCPSLAVVPIGLVTPEPFATSMAPPASPPPSQRTCRPNRSFDQADAAVVYKIALCHQEICEWDDVITELETIPPHLRSATVCSMLGRVYRRLGQRRLSIQAYTVGLPRPLSPP
jgi:hypothetical protein